MTQEEIKDIEEAKLYLDGLVICSNEFDDDDWILEFLQCWINFLTNMSLKYPKHHKFGNKYMHGQLDLKQ